jgi:hypothetical protein
MANFAMIGFYFTDSGNSRTGWGDRWQKRG